MTRLIATAICCLILSACTTLKPEENPNVECVVATRGNLFVSYFPIKEAEQEIWVWNIKKPVIFDYSWVGEPGNIDKDGKFTPDRFAFGMAHWNDSSYRPEAKGSIEELITVSGGRAYIYLNVPDRDERAKADKQLSAQPMQVLYRDGGVMIASRDLEVKKVLLANRPTHAKLTVKTPYPSQSYECIAQIYYDEGDQAMESSK